MKLLLLTVLMTGVLLGCDVQTYNSSSEDESSLVPTVTGDSNFLAANAIFRQKCSACHDFHRKSAGELVAEGKVVAGNLAASSLYARLRGAGVGGNENMPTIGTITGAELAIIQRWILNLTP
jgi:hypothetical protein